MLDVMNVSVNGEDVMLRCELVLDEEDAFYPNIHPAEDENS